MNKKPEADSSKIDEQPAGSFSAWLEDMRSALLDGKGIEVPCGDCNACCKSSYFIHIKPDEKETINRIDKKLLFPAPGLPRGNKLLGYFENGQCPLLANNKCSIYEFRSQTCRAYDCRIFTAAGIEAGDEDKALVNERVHRWKFSYPNRRDREEHAAVQAAARFLLERAECFPAGKVPNNASQLAILAIKGYEEFLNDNGPIGTARTDSELAQAVVEANEEFESRRDNVL